MRWGHPQPHAPAAVVQSTDCGVVISLAGEVAVRANLGWPRLQRFFPEARLLLVPQTRFVIGSWLESSVRLKSLRNRAPGQSRAMSQIATTHRPAPDHDQGRSRIILERTPLLGLALTVCLASAFAVPAWAQKPAPAKVQNSVPPKADSASTAATKPEVKPGDGRRVLVKVDYESAPVVAKVHFQVEDELGVILPDGQFTDVLARDATPTERPFQAISKDALAKRLLEGDFSKGDFQTKQTKRFLYIYNTSETFYIGTSRILETMYPGLFAYCKKQKLDVRDPDVPLVVIMFRTKNEFDAFKKMPDGVVAYYSGLTNQVVMYEQSRLSQVAPEIAVKLAISTVAHEGVHQILQNIGVQQRLSRWPMWISEGLPEYFSPTELGANIRWKGVGTVNDLRMRELETYVRVKQDSVRPGETILATVRSQNLTSTGYASAWALTHFLASRKQANFVAYLQEVSKLGPLETWSPDEGEAKFMKHFGGKLDELEGAELIHLRGLPYVDPLRR